MNRGWVAPLFVAATITAVGFTAAAAPKPADAYAEVLYYLPFEYGTEVGVWWTSDEGEDETSRYGVEFGPFPARTPVVAIASGKVIFVKENADGPTGKEAVANKVAIQLANGSVTTYNHLRKDGAIVEVGDTVLAGDRIAFAASLGKPTECLVRVELHESEMHGKSVVMHFAEGHSEDRVLDAGQLVKSRNRLRVGALADLVELEEEYALCAGLGAQGAVVEEMRKFADSANADRMTIALKKCNGRDDLPELFAAARKRLLSRWNSDATAALARLDAALAASKRDEALLLGRCAVFDFGGGEQEKALKERLAPLRTKDAMSATDAKFSAETEFRKALGAAATAERAARREARADRRADWKGVEKLYRAALAKGAGRGDLTLLQARIDAVVAGRR